MAVSQSSLILGAMRTYVGNGGLVLQDHIPFFCGPPMNRQWRYPANVLPMQYGLLHCLTLRENNFALGVFICHHFIVGVLPKILSTGTQGQ